VPIEQTLSAARFRLFERPDTCATKKEMSDQPSLSCHPGRPSPPPISVDSSFPLYQGQDPRIESVVGRGFTLKSLAPAMFSPDQMIVPEFEINVEPSRAHFIPDL
jgi:hypothetical protein